MDFLRVQIKGWTASFRYPIFISGTQPSLPIPPLTTIYGLISSVCGKIVTPDDTKVGFIFQSVGKFTDLESIYEFSSYKDVKTNVVFREILFKPELMLYISNIELIEYFKKPKHCILLGRSSDLAFIDNIKIISLNKKPMVRCGGSLFPFPIEGINGILQALPTHFTDSIPRKTIGTKIFYLVETDFNEKNKLIQPQYIKTPLYYDSEYNWGF